MEYLTKKNNMLNLKLSYTKNEYKLNGLYA